MSKNIEELTTIPIIYSKQHKERLVLLEFQGSLSISKLNTETGEIINSENNDDFNDTAIGQLNNFDKISQCLKNPEIVNPMESAIQCSKNHQIELKVGYHKLIGKLVRLEKPLAVIQNSSETQEEDKSHLNIYDIIHFKLVFESRPLFSS
ncbi:Ctf8 family protein [Cryptosporidium meleagridis]|uniref:Ctf8 family protein n=1 Tax=Cryptosporidium meleagridis TaxID=93969 RepID=A0A2P4Z2H9_9CRYT|nr:Ctf8 family protein [Cryptosporidium meleagridis]